MQFYDLPYVRNDDAGKGIAEAYRVLKPQGRLLVLDLALPTQPLQRFIAKKLFGSMLQHDLHELLPLIGGCWLLRCEIAQAKFRVMGLSVLSFRTWMGRKELSV